MFPSLQAARWYSLRYYGIIAKAMNQILLVWHPVNLSARDFLPGPGKLESGKMDAG
jgi:hypothetical protein